MTEPRFVHLEVDPCEAAPDGIELRFRAIGDDRVIHQARIDGGEPVRVQAILADETLGEAIAAEVEDSSEGVATLIRGGPLGLLLTRDGTSFREPYLVIAKERV